MPVYLILLFYHRRSNVHRIGEIMSNIAEILSNNVEDFMTKILETAAGCNMQVEIDGKIDSLDESVATMLEIRLAAQSLIMETLRDFSFDDETQDSIKYRFREDIVRIIKENDFRIRSDFVERLRKIEVDRIEKEGLVESINKTGLL